MPKFVSNIENIRQKFNNEFCQLKVESLKIDDTIDKPANYDQIPDSVKQLIFDQQNYILAGLLLLEVDCSIDETMRMSINPINSESNIEINILGEDLYQCVMNYPIKIRNTENFNFVQIGKIMYRYTMSERCYQTRFPIVQSMEIFVDGHPEIIIKQN